MKRPPWRERRTACPRSRKPFGALVPVFLAAALASAACNTDWDPDALAHGVSDPSAASVRRGREIYGRYCIGCHGAQGDGKGPAARFLDPKPRDFRTGKVKFAAVPAGELPRDEDFMTTIAHGLSGTSMPSWRLLPLSEQRDVVAYIKTFSDAFAKKPPGVPVAIGKDPWRRDPAAAIAEGERVYHGVAGCPTCHPAYVTKDVLYRYQTDNGIKVVGFRPDLYKSVKKESQWGVDILPPDFLVDRIKTGFDKSTIVQVISAGVGGTAMPTWAGGLKERQIWGLAYYIESLALMRGTAEGRALQKKLADQPPFEIPAPPAEPTEAAPAEGAPGAPPAEAPHANPPSEVKP